MSQAIEEQIREKLTAITGPAGARIAGIAVEGAQARITLEVDPARGAALEPMRQAAEDAVRTVAGINETWVVLTAERNAPPQATATVKGPAAKQAQPAFSHKISSKPVAPGVKHMIAVASGKGGVGKSTVSANLALAFQALGKKTGLLDADIYGASQPVMMGLHEKPETNEAELIVPPKNFGIDVMSMGFFVDPEAPVIWRGPMVHSAIQQLLRDVDWGDLDILVIDLPPGTGDAQLSLAQYVPLSGAVIVSTPQDVALTQAKKGLKMFEKTSVPVLGMIENMSYHQCTACGHREHIFDHGHIRAAAEKLKVPFLGEIPLQAVIREKADQGTPIVVADPGHPSSEIFMNIAARIWASLPAVRPEKASPQKQTG